MGIQKDKVADWKGRLKRMLDAEVAGHGEPEDPASIAAFRQQIEAYNAEGVKFTPKWKLLKKAKQEHTSLSKAQKAKEA